MDTNSWWQCCQGTCNVKSPTLRPGKAAKVLFESYIKNLMTILANKL